MNLDFPPHVFYSQNDLTRQKSTRPLLSTDKRVMVVDDDDDFRMLLCDRVKRMGPTCLEAENGEVARLQLVQDLVDLVITDYRMPKMDGLELIEWMQSNQQQAAIILISGDLNKSIREKAERAKVYAIVEKPCSLSELAVKIEEALTTP